MTKTSVSVDKEQFKGDKIIIAAKFGKKCTSIGESAFEDCISLESINNEDNVIESIGNLAFAKTNLSTVSFKSLTKLYPSAFSDCKNLKYVDISNYTSTIPEFAFRTCVELENIEIPNVSKIENGSFENCEKLSQVTLSSCESIGAGAFKNCKNLSYIKLSDNCTEIGSSAFYDCKGLENINLKNVKKINTAAFYGCENLSQVTLSSCEFIDDAAFKNCDNLTDVYINNPEGMICKLNSPNVFCNHNGISTECDKNIRFYVNFSDYYTYINDKSWEHYKNNIVAKVESTQIRYRTNNNTRIEIDFKEYNIASNQYNIEYGGLIVFNDAIVGLRDMFKGQTTLTHIELPSTCKSIANYSFSGCVNLTNIEMDGVKSIGLFAFENCKSLKTFKIPDSITILNEGIFAGCEKLEKFEGNYTKYDGKAVVYKNKLISVVPKDNSKTEGRIHNISDIDESITHLGQYCFSGCKNMRRVDIPSNITSIGNNAFDGCSNLYEVHFVGNKPPKTLGDDIFNNVNYDFKIFAPEENLPNFFNNKLIDKLHPKPKSNCIIYYGNKLNGLRQTTKDYNFANGKNITYHIIHDIKNDTVLNYFEGAYNITKVIIGDGLLNISSSAFSNCKDLEYIYLSDKIKRIQNRCFYSCESLKRIHIPINAELGYELFVNCKKLQEFGTYYKGYVSDDNRCYMVPTKGTNYKTLKLFAAGGVDESSTIKDYTIPTNVDVIEKYTFIYTDINKITLNNNITEIKDGAFSNCTSLTEISGINNSNISNLKYIGANTFKNCKTLSTFNISESVSVIGESAFENCKKYTGNLTLFVASLGNKCFKNSGITGIKLNKRDDSLYLTNIPNNAFENCEGLEKIDITNSNVTYIGSYAFAGCKNLSIPEGKEHFLPQSVRIINDYAFYKCGKIEIAYLPENLTCLGDYCFLTESNTKIYLPYKFNYGIPEFTKNYKPNTNSNPFGDIKSNIPLPYIYIPDKMEIFYKANEYWVKYQNRFINQNNK